jgi:hypothetical protein
MAMMMPGNDKCMLSMTTRMMTQCITMHCKWHRDWAGTSATNKATPAQKATWLPPMPREARLSGKVSLTQKKILTRQHRGKQGKFSKDCKISMMTRLPRGGSCQDGNFAKDGDVDQEGKSAKKGNVAAVGKYTKDSNVVKKPTDNAAY